MNGAAIVFGGPYSVVEATNPTATSALKQVYLAKTSTSGEAFLKVVTLQIAFSGSQVTISQTAASFKSGFSDITTVDVNAVMASGMSEQYLAGSSTANGYGAATVEWSFNEDASCQPPSPPPSPPPAPPIAVRCATAAVPGSDTCCPAMEQCLCREDCVGNWGPNDANGNDAYCSGGGPRISC